MGVAQTCALAGPPVGRQRLSPSALARDRPQENAAGAAGAPAKDYRTDSVQVAIGIIDEGRGPGSGLLRSISRGSPEEDHRVLIIGAGPAGLTAAVALRRVGITVALFERAQEVAKTGAGLGVQSNALRALQKLGAGGPIQAAGTELRIQETLDRHGKLLFTMPKGKVADDFGTPTISVARSDVQRVLFNLLEDGVLRTGCECVGVQQDPEGVTATFADGRIERGALLIGADGGRSVVRGHVYGEGDPSPRYSGFTIWRAIVQMAPGVLPPHTSRTFLGSGLQFAMFPVGGNRIYWGVMQLAPEAQRDPRSGRRERLADTLAAFPEVTRRLVQATDEVDIDRTDHLRPRPRADLAQRTRRPDWRRRSHDHSVPGPGSRYRDGGLGRPGQGALADGRAA